MARWKLESTWDLDEVRIYLAEGWEPFAVTSEMSSDRSWKAGEPVDTPSEVRFYHFRWKED